MTKQQLPASYEEMIHRISSQYDALSKRLKQIASYALDHPNEFAIDTIAETSRKARVQPSALIRFAKAFGFDGFSEVQKIFQKRLLENTPSYETRLQAVKVSTGNTPQTLLNQFAEANIASLQQLQRETSMEKLEDAIRILDQADNIYILAMRRAFPLAAYIYYSLASMHRNSYLVDNTGGLYQEQTRHISSNDALIVASFSGYTPYVIQTAKEAMQRNVPVVAFTDHQLSPLTHAATICFHVGEAAVHDFHSLNASMCLAQSLVVGLGVQSIS